MARLARMAWPPCGARRPCGDWLAHGLIKRMRGVMAHRPKNRGSALGAALGENHQSAFRRKKQRPINYKMRRPVIIAHKNRRREMPVPNYNLLSAG